MDKQSDAGSKEIVCTDRQSRSSMLKPNLKRLASKHPRSSRIFFLELSSHSALDQGIFYYIASATPQFA